MRSLALPGSYSEKMTHLGRSLLGFTRIKHLDLSRNAIESLEVTPCMLILLRLFKTHMYAAKRENYKAKLVSLKFNSRTFELYIDPNIHICMLCLYDKVDSPLQGLDHLKHLETLNLYPSSNIY